VDNRCPSIFPLGTLSASGSMPLTPGNPFKGRHYSGEAILLAVTEFTSVTACMLAESPRATLYTRGFSSFVTSTAAPIATGWSEPVPGRDFPAVDQRLSRRTHVPE
jgi:hypothetical protein